MKRIISSLIITLLVLSGCGDLELRYYTRINPDGSVFKRITAVGDSSKVYKNPFSFDISDGWTLTYTKQVENTDTLFMAIAEKTFSSVETSKMACYSEVDSGQHENVIIGYKKKFRWFFTFHEYSETFQQRFPYRYYKVGDFISKDEQDYFFREDTTVIDHLNKAEKDVWIRNGEQKLWQFIAKSINAEYINLLDSFAIDNGYDRVSNEQQQLLYDIFYKSFEDGPGLKEICELADSILSTSWVSPLYNSGYFDHFNHEVDHRMLLLTSRKYLVEIEVPGLIYNSNADAKDKQIVKWTFKGDLFQYSDLKLYVDYRTTNWWAFVVTVCVVLVLLWKAFAINRIRD